jgi:DNA modification methylase
MWIAGDHRVLCADATAITSLELVLGGGAADMVFTDPPYNVDYHQRAAGRGARRIANDNLGLAFEDFLSDACRNLLEVTNGAIYICMSSSELGTLKKTFTEAGGHWSTFIIWAKNTFTLGRSDYQRQYEPILYGWREGSHHYWSGARDLGDVWLVNKPAASDLHPTMKPVELVERAILNSSERGAVVLDPFAGSGSTMIACQRTGRKGRLIEIDASYSDIAVIRWQEFTGGEAILDGDGRTFREITEARTPQAMAS